MAQNMQHDDTPPPAATLASPELLVAGGAISLAGAALGLLVAKRIAAWWQRRRDSAPSERMLAVRGKTMAEICAAASEAYPNLFKVGRMPSMVKICIVGAPSAGKDELGNHLASIGSETGRRVELFTAASRTCAAAVDESAGAATAAGGLQVRQNSLSIREQLVHAGSTSAGAGAYDPHIVIATAKGWDTSDDDAAVLRVQIDLNLAVAGFRTPNEPYPAADRGPQTKEEMIAVLKTLPANKCATCVVIAVRAIDMMTQGGATSPALRQALRMLHYLANEFVQPGPDGGHMPVHACIAVTQCDKLTSAGMEGAPCPDATVDDLIVEPAEQRLQQRLQQQEEEEEEGGGAGGLGFAPLVARTRENVGPSCDFSLHGWLHLTKEINIYSKDHKGRDGRIVSGSLMFEKAVTMTLARAQTLIPADEMIELLEQRRAQPQAEATRPTSRIAEQEHKHTLTAAALTAAAASPRAHKKLTDDGFADSRSSSVRPTSSAVSTPTSEVVANPNGAQHEQ